MGNPLVPGNLSYLGAGDTGRKRVGSNGMLEIICRICEKKIVTQSYQGFSTAICAVCQGQIEAGKRPEDIIAAKGKEEANEAADLYNDLGPGGFKVFGIGKRFKEVVEKVKETATKRKRKALFSEKDKL